MVCKFMPCTLCVLPFTIEILLMMLTYVILSPVVLFSKIITVTDDKFTSPNVNNRAYSKVSIRVILMMLCSSLKKQHSYTL